MKKLNFLLIGLLLGIGFGSSGFATTAATPDKEAKGATLVGVSPAIVQTLKDAGIDQDVAQRGVDKLLTAKGVTDDMLRSDYNPAVDPKNADLRALVAGQMFFGEMIDLIGIDQEAARKAGFSKVAKDLAALKAAYTEKFDTLFNAASTLK